MGRILDLFSRLEKKIDKPADPDLLLGDDADRSESGDSAEERKSKVRRQRRAKSMRWGGE